MTTEKKQCEHRKQAKVKQQKQKEKCTGDLDDGCRMGGTGTPLGCGLGNRVPFGCGGRSSFISSYGSLESGSTVGPLGRAGCLGGPELWNLGKRWIRFWTGPGLSVSHSMTLRRAHILMMMIIMMTTVMYDIAVAGQNVKTLHVYKRNEQNKLTT